MLEKREIRRKIQKNAMKISEKFKKIGVNKFLAKIKLFILGYNFLVNCVFLPKNH